MQNSHVVSLALVFVTSPSLKFGGRQSWQVLCKSHLTFMALEAMMFAASVAVQCAAYWDNRAQQLSKHMVFLTNDIALSNRALALGIHTDQATHWLKQAFWFCFFFFTAQTASANRCSYYDPSWPRIFFFSSEKHISMLSCFSWANWPSGSSAKQHQKALIWPTRPVTAGAAQAFWFLLYSGSQCFFFRSAGLTCQVLFNYFVWHYYCPVCYRCMLGAWVASWGWIWCRSGVWCCCCCCDGYFGINSQLVQQELADLGGRWSCLQLCIWMANLSVRVQVLRFSVLPWTSRSLLCYFSLLCWAQIVAVCI